MSRTKAIEVNEALKEYYQELEITDLLTTPEDEIVYLPEDELIYEDYE